MSYLAMARAFEVKLKAERDPGAVLAEVYRKYWTTPESASMESFQSIHNQIDLEEQKVGVDTAWHTLEAVARTWFEEHRACPFCKHPDVLHLGTEQA